MEPRNYSGERNPTTRGASPREDPAEGTPAPHGDPLGCWCITGWGRFQRQPGLRAPPCLLSPPTQLWMLLNTPFPPKAKSPHHYVSFSSASSSFQQQTPGTWETTTCRHQALALEVDFATWKNSATAPQGATPQVGGFGFFQFFFCNKPLRGYKNKSALACSPAGLVVFEGGSQLQAGTGEMGVAAADAEPGVVPVHPWDCRASGTGSAGRRLLEMSAGLNAAEK